MIYGTETVRYLDLLAKEGLADMKDDVQLLVIREEMTDLEASHPTDGDRAKAILLRPSNRISTRRGLATQYGIHATEVTMILNLSRPLRSDVLLAAVLLLDQVPSVYEVNHMLMEVGSPCLFCETAYPDVNRRNYLLTKILEYAAKTGPYPGEGYWLDFAEAVLTRFRGYYQDADAHRWGEDQAEMERLRRLTPKEQPRVIFTDAQEEMLGRWRHEIDRVSHCDYSLTRAELLTAYMAQTGLPRGQAITALANEIFVTRETCSALFAKMGATNSKGSRETILALAVALGCDADQANTLLMQINEPLLYPFQQREDDVYWLKKLTTQAGTAG